MSYKLKYTGEQIDNILDRAVEGGTIDDALVLKAPLESPALTGTPTAPTPDEGDNSTKVATTEYADRAADAAGAAAEAAAKEYTDAATGALYITDTASGSIASFSDGADGVAMRSVVVNITPVQSGSGDPAPDNVRPISGWNQVKITRAGRNLLPVTIDRMTALNAGGTWAGNVFTKNGVAFTVDETAGTITASGTANANTVVLFASRLATSSNRFALPDGSYTLSGCPAGGSSATYEIRFQATRNDALHTYGYDRGSGVTGIVLGTDILQVAINIGSGTTVNDLVFRPMLRLASDTDATFEPYAGQTFPVTWESQAGEVFGGYFAVNSDGSVGLTATHKVNNFASGSWSINTDGSLPYFQRTVTAVDTEQRASALSNIYINQTPTAGNTYDMAFGFTGSNNFFRVRDSRYTTVADFVAHLQNDNVQFYYPLLTPQAYHLDSIGQITSLLGQNNVWSNTGDVEVEYVADPKLYIAKMLGGGTLTVGSVSPLSANRPVTISEEDLEQADEVNKAVEAAVETVLPAESGETEEGAQE